MADERLEELERRVAELEGIVRQLLVRSIAAPLARSGRDLPTRNAAQAPLAAPVAPVAPRVLVKPKLPLPITDAEPIDWEQWVGQRGLLAVGVAALLIAAAFFLKYAFDRGWVPPLVRSVGSVLAGTGVAAWGHDRIRRGMRRFGGSMIGAGGGLVYLGLWAAAGPYALMERRVGILLLAGTTVAVTYLALHHEIEGLAIWALAGAYLAPIILATAPNPLGFLSYLEVIGLGTAITAYAMGWRATFDLALLGYLLLAAAGAADAIATPLGAWLVAAGALLTLEVTWRRSWPEARLVVPLLAWPILGTGFVNMTGPPSTRWLSLGAALAVTGLVWSQHVRRDPYAPVAAKSGQRGDIAVDRLLFVLNPLAFLILAALVDVPVLNDSYQVVPATLAAAYLAAGWTRRSASQLITGFLVAAVAIAFAWSTASTTAGWSALMLLALAAERNGARPGGRHAALTLATAAWVWHFTIALDKRGYLAPVFTDPWALALYSYVVAAIADARWWDGAGAMGLTIWTLAGSAVFIGGSVEFHEYFARTTTLAGDLALSVWWLLFAGALVFLGFRLNQKPVRSTGLGVAAFAALKIVAYDLSALSALYRVGSFFVLALITLAVAYAYNQRARRQARASAE